MDLVQVTVILLGVAGFASTLVAVRLSGRRWVRWAQRAASYGTTDILNAKYVDSDEAVVRLRAEFDAWSTIVKDGTARFCREEDAHRVQFFATPLSPGVTGFNDEHRYIRDATAERVRRLLDLAARVEARKTGLRQRWVPRVG
jgi:hypothetical protein